MKSIDDTYETQVYTGMLGKTIGVYLGRPFEGWSKDAIEAKWGQIDHYVHEDQCVPLVVADDDLSGTFTFIKILADSGLYEMTPDRLFGENWLNYVFEGLSVFWWGGVSHSTEHTAFLNLKHGIESPQSGAMARNGREVSEQIGAQIFIDAFGLVAPGDPALAIRIAEKAARVSHDGAAVHAAQVVAAMTSLAFVVRDMDRILDEAIAFIPADSIIAAVHHDVRAWAALDGDWRKTHARIDEKYGYRHYGGGCHVVPNHALMVMAWAYAQSDFFEAMRIVCTAGWDTDCNAANVGTISALVAGLDHLGDRYDFRTPFADRLVLPTADGTDIITDVLRQSMAVAKIGRRVMKMNPLSPPKNGALHHFEMPGALHGYQPQDNASVANVAAPAGFSGRRAMRLHFDSTREAPARIATPTLFDPAGQPSWYRVMSTPLLCNGMTVCARIRCTSTSESADLRLFAKPLQGDLLHSQPVRLTLGLDTTLAWIVEAGDIPLAAFGFQVDSDIATTGDILVDWVDFSGAVDLAFPKNLPSTDARNVPGWLSNLDTLRPRFPNDLEEILYLGKNEGMGVLVTGNRHWKDSSIASGFKIHAAARAGLLLHYQGMRRYYAIAFTKTTLQIVRNLYGETVLGEVAFGAEENKIYDVSASAKDGKIEVSIDGEIRLIVRDATLDGGGIGFFVEQGLAGFHSPKIWAAFERTLMKSTSLPRSANPSSLILPEVGRSAP